MVWDWNGTLLDDAWLCVEVMRGLLAKYELPGIDLARYGDVFGFPVKDYYVDLGFDFSRTPFETVGTEFIDGYAARENRCCLREGARRVIEHLEAADVTQSVLSASEKPRLLGQARRLGIESFFEDIVALDDHYAGGKTVVGRQWLKASGHAPGSVLLVGDTDHDVDVAAELGIHCVLVPSGHQSKWRLSTLGVHIIDSLEVLPDVLGPPMKESKLVRKG